MTIIKETIRKHLAEKVAEKLTDRLFDQLMDAVHDITSEVCEEELSGLIDQGSTEYFDLLMEISGSIYIGSN
jgi:transcriptional accessory protein Tex/SPT6